MVHEPKDLFRCFEKNLLFLEFARAKNMRNPRERNTRMSFVRRLLGSWEKFEGETDMVAGSSIFRF
jgi:hypothetical protein